MELKDTFMKSDIPVPSWIAATQRRPRFVAMTEESLDAALRHYAGAEKFSPKKSSQVERSKVALPAYLTQRQATLTSDQSHKQLGLF